MALAMLRISARLSRLRLIHLLIKMLPWRRSRFWRGLQFLRRKRPVATMSAASWAKMLRIYSLLLLIFGRTRDIAQNSANRSPPHVEKRSSVRVRVRFSIIFDHGTWSVIRPTFSMRHPTPLFPHQSQCVSYVKKCFCDLCTFTHNTNFQNF